MTADPDPRLLQGAPRTEGPNRGRQARWPHEIPLRGWKDVLWRTYREIGRDRLSVVAGGVAFHSLIAMAPAVGVFVALYGLVADVGEVGRQLDQLTAFVPAEVLVIVGEQMMRLAGQREAELSAAFLASLVLSVWTASLGIRVLLEAVNIAYEETETRNILVRAAVTYAATLAGLMFLILVTALLVAAPLALRLAGIESLDRWLAPVRWLVVYALAAGAFAVLYRYGPSRARARWRWVSWGAVFAATAWMAGSLGYSWYVSQVARFDVAYGSLGALVGFLVWIWVSVMAILVGAELNAEIEHQTSVDSTVGAPRPMGQRGAVVADSLGRPFVGVRTLWDELARQLRALSARLRPGPSS